MMKFLGLTVLLINSPRISCAQDEDLLDRVAYAPGNFTIAALFSVHEACSNLYYPKCGSIQDQAGMQRVMAALFELEEINKHNKKQNYNHTFGLEIRDTCGSYVYAFQQGLSIHNTVSSSSNSHIVGAVGPAFSAEVRITYEWLGKTMPQVGFSATSPRMTTKRDDFKHFARLVPPDTFQARLISDLLKFFNQTVVNSIITAGVYGSDAVKVFIEEAGKLNICVGSREIVYDDANDTELENIFKNSTDFNRIVVCFCEGRTVRRFYKIADRFDLHDQVLFISSDGWTEIDNVTQNFEHKNFGSIMINTSPQLKLEDNFTDHYKTFYNELFYNNFSHRSKSENPWAEEFHQYLYNCSSNSSANNATNTCNGNGTLRKDFFPDPKLPLVRYSIRVIAEATNQYIKNKCKPSQQCDMKDLGLHFMEFIKNTSTIKNYDNSSFEFNNSDPKVSNYDILSYGKDEHGNLTIHVIGNWSDTSGLKLNESLYMNKMVEKYRNIKENCNPQCRTGQYHLKKNCCWSCQECNDTSVSDGSTCVNCDICKTPDSKKSNCIDKENSLVFKTPGGCLCIFISLLGAAFTLYTAYLFYKYRRTPIVKFSSTHLSYIIFCGMGLAYSCTLLNLWEPTSFTCIVLRFIPSISLTMIYGPILMKTNRISRALSATKKRFPTLRMKYLSAAFLVLVSLLFVLADVIVCTVEIIIASNEGRMTNIEPNCTGKTKIVSCPTESIAEFNFRHIVNVFLLVYCAFYAYRSGLHLPDNFNETKFVIVSCCTTAIVWAVFLVSFIFYQKSESWAERTLCLSLALSLSALINLVCMYFPKLYVILYRPKQNHRAFYSTVTEMRCYFGNTESRVRGFSSVNMDSTAGDPNLITEQNIKNKKKDSKRRRSGKTEQSGKKSKYCGANGLICTCEAMKSISN